MRCDPLLAFLLAVALALAGCADGGGDPSPADGPSASELGLAATATTGLLRGVVVDEAIRPVANATVTLGSTGESTATTEVGAFGFDGLEPGTYFVTVTKLGYVETTQSAEVVAGVAEPPVVKVLLTVDATFRAFFEAFVYEGFIECTTSFLVLCGAPNTIEPIMCEEFQTCYGNLTNDRFTWTQFFQDDVTMVQSEMVWSSNQAASPELSLSQEALTSDCPNTDLSTTLNSTTGPSPVFARVFEDVLDEYEIGADCGIYYSVFSGDVVDEPCSPELPEVGSVCPTGGATVEQRFTVYMHAFYGYLPPADWRFSADSTVPPPPV